MLRPVSLVLLLLVTATGIPASRHKSHRTSGQAGAFDFYLFVLSWSPEFCYSHPSAAQCSKHTGFIVHGLWPQNNDGSYPLDCQTSQPGPSNPDSMADIMPAEIIQHEWIQHGTCSGLSGDEYFALIRKLSRSIRIPERMKAPAQSLTISTADLKRAFEEANPGLDDREMAIQLRGNYLNAVEFCRAKAANPAPATCSGVKDTRSGTFVIPPVH